MPSISGPGATVNRNNVHRNRVLIGRQRNGCEARSFEIRRCGPRLGVRQRGTGQPERRPRALRSERKHGAAAADRVETPDLLMLSRMPGNSLTLRRTRKNPSCRCLCSRRLSSHREMSATSRRDRLIVTIAGFVPTKRRLVTDKLSRSSRGTIVGTSQPYSGEGCYES